MNMKRKYYWYINKVFSLYLLMLFLAMGMASCDEETSEEDHKLKGDISQYVPKYACGLDATILNGSDGYAYMKFTPTVIADLPFWGLQLKDAKYFINGEVIGTGSGKELSLETKANLLSTASYNVKAQFTIGGEECNDVIIEDEKNMYVIPPSTDGFLYIDYNYVTKGDILHIVPYAPPSNTIHINKVTYYWDGKTYEATTSPYDWKHQITEDVDTKHDLKVTVNYTRGNSTATYSLSYSNFRILGEEDEIANTELMYDIKEYKNGQTVQLASKSYVGSGKKESYEVKYYLDDKLIGQTSTFPYIFNYKLTNETEGIHRFKCQAILKYEDGTEKLYTYNNIDILVTK